MVNCASEFKVVGEACVTVKAAVPPATTKIAVERTVVATAQAEKESTFTASAMAAACC